MTQIVLIGVCAVAICVITWWTARLIDAMRNQERLADRLEIDDC
jgi:hypothetical protein